jgi:hypothetical protein
VEICVADDGPGIPDAEKPKVAQRFYRGDTSRGTPGVGLGLSLVQAVAKLHGGTLELTDNHPGLRARFGLASALLSGRPRAATVEARNEAGDAVKTEPSAMPVPTGDSLASRSVGGPMGQSL